MKKYLLLPILSIFTVCAFAESAISVSPVRWDEAEAKADALLAQMTDEEKVGQMIQAERRYMKISDITKYCLGSVLSGGGSAPGPLPLKPALPFRLSMVLTPFMGTTIWPAQSSFLTTAV